MDRIPPAARAEFISTLTADSTRYAEDRIRANHDNPTWTAEYRAGFRSGVIEATTVFTEVLLNRIEKL